MNSKCFFMVTLLLSIGSMQAMEQNSDSNKQVQTVSSNGVSSKNESWRHWVIKNSPTIFKVGSVTAGLYLFYKHNQLKQEELKLKYPDHYDTTYNPYRGGGF